MKTASDRFFHVKRSHVHVDFETSPFAFADRVVTHNILPADQGDGGDGGARCRGFLFVCFSVVFSTEISSRQGLSAGTANALGLLVSLSFCLQQKDKIGWQSHLYHRCTRAETIEAHPGIVFFLWSAPRYTTAVLG